MVMERVRAHRDLDFLPIPSLIIPNGFLFLVLVHSIRHARLILASRSWLLRATVVLCLDRYCLAVRYLRQNL
jgi:hypothetical protein